MGTSSGRAPMWQTATHRGSLQQTGTSSAACSTFCAQAGVTGRRSLPELAVWRGYHHVGHITCCCHRVLPGLRWGARLSQDSSAARRHQPHMLHWHKVQKAAQVG